MFLLLIIVISLLIRVLRLLISKTEVAVYSETKNYIKKGAYYSSNAVFHTVVNALRALRVMLLSVGSVIIVFEIICALLLMFNAAGAFLLYYSDETSSGSNYTTVTSSSSNSYTGSLDFSDVTNVEAREYLQKLAQSWTSEVTEERRALIIKGATRIGISTYSQSYAEGRGGSSDDQRVFDCSSFTGWCFNKTGHTDVSTYETTATFISSSSFKQISADELIPGDIALNSNTPYTGNSNHVGIYVGDDNGVKMFMHCTKKVSTNSVPVGTIDGVRISEHSNFTVFYRYLGWNS